MNLTPEELGRLKACKSDEEWNAACDAVKATRNGDYPPDWWPVMKLSGLMDQILGSFGSDSDIHLLVWQPDGTMREIKP